MIKMQIKSLWKISRILFVSLMPISSATPSIAVDNPPSEGIAKLYIPIFPRITP